jgi:hypothetical protein
MEKNPTPGYWWGKKKNYFSVIKIVLDKEPMVMEFGSICQIPLIQTDHGKNLNLDLQKKKLMI